MRRPLGVLASALGRSAEPDRDGDQEADGDAEEECDDLPEREVDVYRLQIAQKNGQYAWLTPIWAER